MRMEAARQQGETAGAEIAVAGVAFVADCAGALYWPEESILAVADLHLEKGSSFAERGVLLPPYDTAATLARIAALVARYAPRTVIALGDSFHDGKGPARVAASDRTTLAALQRGRIGSGSAAITIPIQPMVLEARSPSPWRSAR